MKDWEEGQRELMKEGLAKTEVASLAADKQRNSDLAKLQELDGPFTSPEAVDKYISRKGVSEEDKNKRMYIEVHYAKNSSLSFPKSSEVFRLKKQGKNLTTDTYVSNLKAYLSRITCHVNLDTSDFKDALEKLTK